MFTKGNIFNIGYILWELITVFSVINKMVVLEKIPIKRKEGEV